jgi:hypothetical protein
MSKFKAVAYYGGIPPNNNNPEKPLILDNFLQGVRASGDEGVDHRGMNAIPCDVAFVQGFVHEDGKKGVPHLTLRQNAIDMQKQNGKRSLIVDSNLFLFADPGNTKTYLRYSFDGVFPTTGFYFDTEVDPLRWKKISANLGLSLKPWRTQGTHILICCQRNGGWSMKGLSVNQWLLETVAKVRSFSDRPIVIRVHPGDKKWQRWFDQSIFRKYKHITLSKNHIRQDLINAWASIVYNSSPSIASAIDGVPTFVTDPQVEISQSFGVCNTNLKRIEDPKMFERQAWVEKLSMCHWNFDELRSGEAWQFFRKFI